MTVERVRKLEQDFPWLKLVCDECHTMLTGNPPGSPLDLCGRCAVKFDAWCVAAYPEECECEELPTQ
jgi:hypothetical protein